MLMKKYVIVLILFFSIIYLFHFYYVTVNNTGGVRMKGYSGVPFVRNPTLEQRARRNPTFYPSIVRELPDGFITLSEMLDLAPEFSIHYFNFSLSVIGELYRRDLSVRPYSEEFVIFQNQLYIEAEVFNAILLELRELEQDSD